MASPATPGLFFCIAAMTLLIFVCILPNELDIPHLRICQVSVSVPTWDSVYFLSASNGGSNLRFGVFGYTGSTVHLGYRFPITYVSR